MRILLVRARSAALEVAELIRLGRQLMPELGEGVLSAAQQGCDVLLLSATLAPLGQVVAEGLGLPSIGVFLQPMTPPASSRHRYRSPGRSGHGATTWWATSPKR